MFKILYKTTLTYKKCPSFSLRINLEKNLTRATFQGESTDTLAKICASSFIITGMLKAKTKLKFMFEYRNLCLNTEIYA